MKANEESKSKFVYPDKLYARCKDNKTLDISYAPQTLEAVEYIRTDAFIEKAAEYIYNYNQKQVLKHGARATLGCGEYTVNVDEFRKYMEESNYDNARRNN